ncbi:MAG TPA: ATP-binding protein [Gemmatimonadaceae bacterium]
MNFNPRRVLRGLYTGRLALATGLFLSAVAAGIGRADSAGTIVSLALVSAIAFTLASFVWTDLTGHTPGPSFLYLQVAFDMLLVTAAVHVTWTDGHSQLAPLYILVIAVSALLTAPSGVPLVASLGMVLYFADAMLLHGGEADVGLLIHLLVFTIVALVSGIISAKLRAASAASESLAAELAEFRLREADMRQLVIRAERLEGIAEMSASIAHEIKNPLASIRSAVEQLSKMPRASDDEKILSALVQRESDRLSRVLTEFLDFARAGMTRVETVDLAAVSKNAAHLVSSQPGIADGVHIVDQFPETPMTIDGDEDLLHRAVFNLLLNAVQASPPNRDVLIEGGELEQHQLPEGAEEFSGGAYGILVTDQGPGIAPQIRDRLFDPFVTTKQGGSGLGLSIVQRAVQAHGGIITVSAPGEETRFTIVLPKTRQTSTNASSGNAADSTHNR